MVKFINKVTGGAMWVHETRVEEYKAAGHRPAEEAQSETTAPPKKPKKQPKK